MSGSSKITDMKVLGLGLVQGLIATLKDREKITLPPSTPSEFWEAEQEIIQEEVIHQSLS